jgi:hypothetical protein
MCLTLALSHRRENACCNVSGVMDGLTGTTYTYLVYLISSQGVTTTCVQYSSSHTTYWLDEHLLTTQYRLADEKWRVFKPGKGHVGNSKVVSVILQEALPMSQDASGGVNGWPYGKGYNVGSFQARPKRPPITVTKRRRRLLFAPPLRSSPTSVGWGEISHRR